MPFILVTIGLVLFAVAMNGTYGALGSQLYKDFVTNKPPFGMWFLALLVVGMIGYIPGAKKPADTFMFLIIIGMVLASQGQGSGGVFSKFMQAVQQGPKQAAASPLAAVPVQVAGGSIPTSATHQAASDAASNPVASVANGVIGQVVGKAEGLLSSVTGGFL
jgi:hypothetical protein